jgi:hypothetical protein
MKQVLCVLLAFAPVTALAAAAETAAAEVAASEPLGTVYLVCIGLAFVAILAGFYLYYMRWDEEEEKSRD